MFPNLSQLNMSSGIMISSEAVIPMRIFLKLTLSLFIKMQRNIGNIISAELYLVKKANIANENAKIKNFEFFLTAKTRK